MSAFTKSASRTVSTLERDHARVDGNAHDGDGQNGVEQTGSENGDDEDGQQKRREREKDVHQSHQHVVEPLAEVAGDQTDERSDHRPRTSPHRARRPATSSSAEEDSAEHVATVSVGPEDVLRLVVVTPAEGCGCTDLALGVTPWPSNTSLGSYGASSGAKKATRTQHRQHDQTDHGRSLAQQLTEGVPHSPRLGCDAVRLDDRVGRRPLAARRRAAVALRLRRTAPRHRRSTVRRSAGL